jgi:biotin transport system permease protein
MKEQARSPAAGPGRAVARAVLAADARLKIVLAAGFGLVTWGAGPVGLGFFALGFGLAAFCLARVRPGSGPLLRGALAFVLVWAAVQFAFALWEGAEAGAAAARAGLLAGRLGVLVVIGLGLATSASTRELGLAFAWFLRPVLRSRAWQAALALALMVHFLPMTLDTLRQVRRSMQMRRVRMARWRRPALLAQAALRALSQRTWSQTVALAARGLDDAAAWQPSFRTRPMDWLAGAALLAAGLGVAAL